MESSSSSARSRAQPKKIFQTEAESSDGAFVHLPNLPSRGLFDNTILPSSNLGGMRVYVCDHDTSAPEEQVIKTNTTNILIRALQISKQKNEQKDVATSKAPNKGKRSAGKSLEERSSAKRANTNGSSSSSRQEGASAGFSEKTLQSMTVERLRAFLKERGLSPKGKKDELIARLRDNA